MKHIVSLGAGVQSSTMALMAAHGELKPMPEIAVFADTQSEPASVYQWLDWLETQLPFPVIRVTAGSLSEHVLDMRVTKNGRIFAKTDIPFFTKSENGKFGMVRHRACTADYKIAPIRRYVKKWASVKHKEKDPQVTQWIGISLDEAHRMKPAREKWWLSRWPLIEKRITRGDCLQWMQRNGYPTPPRSSCVFCPFHSDQEWQRLKTQEPEEFEKAVQFEKEVQAVKTQTNNFQSMPYLHHSRQPLDSVEFSNDSQPDLFGNECEGMCGV